MGDGAEEGGPWAREASGECRRAYSDDQWATQTWEQQCWNEWLERPAGYGGAPAERSQRGSGAREAALSPGRAPDREVRPDDEWDGPAEADGPADSGGEHDDGGGDEQPNGRPPREQFSKHPKDFSECAVCHKVTRNVCEGCFKPACVRCTASPKP